MAEVTYIFEGDSKNGVIHSENFSRLWGDSTKCLALAHGITGAAADMMGAKMSREDLERFDAQSIVYGFEEAILRRDFDKVQKQTH